jgi:hypothetical protein
MKTILIALTLCVVTVGALARPARADDAETDKAKREARVLMKAGVDAYNKRDWEHALEMFQAAYARYPSAKILLNLGSTLRELGRHLEAARAYEKYLQDADSDPAKRDEVTRLLAELDKRLGKLRATMSETDASVLLDGAPWVNPTVVVTRVEPGTHVIRGEKPGFVPVELTVTVAAGEEQVIQVTLVEETRKDPERVAVKEPSRVDVRAGRDVRDDVDEGEPRGGGGGRLRAVVRVSIDPKGKGAAGAAGLGFAVHERVELVGAGLLGPTSGLYVGAVGDVTTGALRPVVSVGAPVLFSDGARVAVRGAAGVGYWFGRLGVTAEVGVEHFVNAEMDHEATYVVPVIGVSGRL